MNEGLCCLLRGVNLMNDHCIAARNKNGSNNFLFLMVFILFL